MITRKYIAAPKIAAAIGAVVAAAFALSGRGTFEYRVLATGFAVAGLVLLLVGVVLHLFARRAGPGSRSLRSIARCTAFAGVVSLSLVEARIAGAILHRSDVRAARAFSEQVVASLHAADRTSGRYPLALEETLRGLPDPPFLFERGGLFTSSGNEFVLSFSEADAVVPRVVQYSSASSRWTRF